MRKTECDGLLLLVTRKKKTIVEALSAFLSIKLSVMFFKGTQLFTNGATSALELATSY